MPEPLARAAPEPRLARLACRRSASALIHASISTRPSSASWTIAGRRSGGIPHRHSEPEQLAPERAQPGGILVQDRREQGGLGDPERVGDVRSRPGAARGDHRHRERLPRRRRQLEVVAAPGAIGVDRREQDLPAPRSLGLARPGDSARAVPRVPACERTTPPSTSIATTTACEPSCSASSVSSSGRSSAAELTATLSAPASSSCLRVGDGAHAAADGERDRSRSATRRTSSTSVAPRVERCLDVEEHELVRARLGVRRRRAPPGRRRRAGPGSGCP